MLFLENISKDHVSSVIYHIFVEKSHNFDYRES